MVSSWVCLVHTSLSLSYLTFLTLQIQAEGKADEEMKDNELLQKAIEVLDAADGTFQGRTLEPQVFRVTIYGSGEPLSEGQPDYTQAYTLGKHLAQLGCHLVY